MMKTAIGQKKKGLADGGGVTHEEGVGAWNDKVICHAGKPGALD